MLGAWSNLVEGLTDESAIDFQVQELENLFGMVGSLDEGSVVDWTHSERLKVVSWVRSEHRSKTEFDRWTMVQKKGR